jgi:hypothetical protein
MTTTLTELRRQVAAIESRPPTPVIKTVHPLAFTLQFRGWVNALGQPEAVTARCLGITPTRLRRLYNHELPTPDETPRIATAMEWPQERIAALVESDRLARALRPVPA